MTYPYHISWALNKYGSYGGKCFVLVSKWQFYVIGGQQEHFPGMFTRHHMHVCCKRHKHNDICEIN